MNIRFLTLAQKEVDESVRWYNEQASLGGDFLDELDRAVRLIKSHPSLPKKSNQKFDVFCCTVSRMP
jgi:hypothetical protein